MALKYDSTTIDAISKLLLTEMWRLGDRTEARCTGIEHNIGPALTASASAIIYDESNFFDEQPVYFGERPIFDKEPVFAEESVFDTKPVFDEELLFNTEPVFDVDPVFDEEFDVDPIFDEEADDSITAGYDVALSSGLGITAARLRHNTAPSLRQASMTSSIDKELVRDSGIGAVALTAIAVVTSDIDIDTPANYSTKCLGRAVIASAAATFLSVAGMSRSVPPPAEPEAAQLLLKLRSDMELAIQLPTKCLMKCPGHTTGAVIRASFPDFTPASLLAIALLDVDPQSLQLLNSEALLYASLSAHKVDSGKYTERQLWPPPTELRITVSGAIV